MFYHREWTVSSQDSQGVQSSTLDLLGYSTHDNTKGKMSSPLAP